MEMKNDPAVMEDAANVPDIFFAALMAVAPFYSSYSTHFVALLSPR